MRITVIGGGIIGLSSTYYLQKQGHEITVVERGDITDARRRTLIVADLIFNFRADERGWNRFFHRYVAGFQRYPGMSRIFRVCISDRASFCATFP